jgi:NAD(P)-dependent dehydrogenase (short-subunit alcohol dehydrogenase family)
MCAELELASAGIAVNALCPGCVDTPMLARFEAALGVEQGQWASTIPIGWSVCENERDCSNRKLAPVRSAPLPDRGRDPGRRRVGRAMNPPHAGSPSRPSSIRGRSNIPPRHVGLSGGESLPPLRR